MEKIVKGYCMECKYYAGKGNGVANCAMRCCKKWPDDHCDLFTKKEEESGDINELKERLERLEKIVYRML